MDNIQTRGHCQICGHIQAVNGRVAHHGYTVQWGFFNGTCGGHIHPPIEADRKALDGLVQQLRKEAAEKNEFADRLEAGTLRLKTIKRRAYDNTVRQWIETQVPVEQADGYEVKSATEGAVFHNRRMARDMLRHADYLLKLADEFHGKPLIQVERPKKPEPIQRGERRISGSGGVLTCTSIQGARIYWSTPRGDKQMNGWTGTQAWRKLQPAN